MTALSVVMPAHNEADLLATSVGEVVAGLRARGGSFEVLVVENGSVDDTLALAHSLVAANPELRVSSLDRPDYGAALRAGLLAATGDVVVNFDVDYYDIDFIDRAVAALGTEADAPAMVVGSKRAPGANDTRSFPRRAVTWGFTTLLRVGFRLKVSDTHGMKAMVRSRVEPLVARCRFDADLFDTELVIRAERSGLHVAEIPVEVAERRPSRTSIARRVLRSIAGLAKLRVVLWREGKPA